MELITLALLLSQHITHSNSFNSLTIKTHEATPIIIPILHEKNEATCQTAHSKEKYTLDLNLGHLNPEILTTICLSSIFKIKPVLPLDCPYELEGLINNLFINNE